MKTKNAKVLPKVFYGLHMVEGVAEYREEGKDPYRICILENAIKKMDASFQGKPVFVLHAEDDLKDILSDIQNRADGYVIESFFNQADGKHWAKFIVVSDDGHAAIQNGWKLSNAYIPQSVPKQGQWHGVDYQKEVISGEYDHLAIVPNPRYEESIILTPEQFKAYNDSKIAELTMIANSKEGESKMKLSFFKKAKVDKIENGLELESLVLEVGKDKKEFTILQLVQEVEKIQNMQGYANGDHMVKVGEEELSVNDLMKKYGDVCNELSELKNKEDEADVDAEEDNLENEDVDGEKDPVENEEDDAEEKKKKEKEKTENDAAIKAAKKANLDKVKNAAAKAAKEKLQNAPVIMLSADGVALGKSRYGK